MASRAGSGLLVRTIMVNIIALSNLQHHAIRLSGNGARSCMDFAVRDKPCISSCRKRDRRDDDGQRRPNKLNLKPLY